MDNRKILLVDMNAFFAGVEQQSNPHLRGKPVLVGGGVGKRSVVAACSYEAKWCGVSSGMPLMKALKLCPDAILIEGNSSKYTDTSKRIFKICRDYTDRLEIYSIDECFMDVTSTQSLFGGAWEVGRGIKSRIRTKLGLTCSIGIAPNKMLAKLASNMKKPDGLTEIKWSDAPSVLENLPVTKLHGIGDRTGAQLAYMGITTAGQLGRTPRDKLKRKFGIIGDVLHEMGQGIDRSPVVPYYDSPDMKSIGHSYTLSKNTRDPDIIYGQLQRLSEKVGRRLRAENYAGKTVSLVVRYEDMHTFSRRKTLSYYLDDGYDIYKAASAIMREQKDPRSVRLLGVCVSNLTKGMYQLDLFTNPRKKELMKTVDTLNDKYGEFTVRPASMVGLEARLKTHGFAGKHYDDSWET